MFVTLAKPFSRHLFTLILLLLLMGLVPSATQAASFVVSSTADTANSVSDPTTLRGAIAASQASPDASDTIRIVVGGTVSLTQGELLISNPKNIAGKTVTISGPGAASFSVSGNRLGTTNVTRVLHITAGTVNLSGLTVTQGGVSSGSIGGAGILLQDATLTMNKCAVSSCFAGVANSLGAGIANVGGALTLTGCTITGNILNSLHTHGAGGIGSENGSLTLQDCTVSGNNGFGQGGGIYSLDETLILTGTTVSGNIAFPTGDSTSTEGDGGGLYSENDALTMTDCSVASNSSNDAGYGLFLVGGSSSVANLRNCTFSSNAPGTNIISTPLTGFGGAIFNASAVLTLTNSTIANNSSTVGGGIYNIGKLTVTDCTLTGNRPLALDNDTGGTATVTSSILAGNSNAAGTGNGDIATTKAGAITSGGSNLIGDPNGNGFVNDPNHADPNSAGNHDQTGVTKPGLSSLADNGGLTATVALNTGSPAIDGDFADATPTDQRGAARPFGARNDIGSFEYGVTIPAKPVNTYLVTNTHDSGAGSLRAAITSADADTGAMVAFDPAIFGPGKPQTILLTSGPLMVTAGMTITGPGANWLAISGGNVSRVFIILPANPNISFGMATITGLTITDGNAGSQTMTVNGVSQTSSIGGGILGYGNVAMSDCVITHCTAPGSTAAGSGGLVGGGGIFLEETNNASLTRCVITGCSAPNGSGGGVYLFGAGCFLTDCTMSGNTAQMGGGFTNQIGPGTAISVIGSSTISGNSATTGGGIYLLNGLTVVNSSTIADNTATTGGGIFTINVIVLANSTIAGNTAKTCGGLDAAMADLSGSTIVGNILAGNTGGNFAGKAGTQLYTEDNNLLGDPNGNGFVNGTNHDLTGVTNPKLGPLQDNGGLTQTMALLPGSPAIDADYDTSANYGNPSGIPDQRGATRPQGVRADIGAYEFGMPVAHDDTYTVKQNKVLTIQAPGVLVNDTADGSNPVLTATLETSPMHGSLMFNHDGSFSYTPNTGFLGTDTFTYQVADGSVAGTTGTVTLTVTNASPPTTTAALNPSAPNGLNGYYTVPITITLKATASANDPGPVTTFYSLDGGAQKTYTAPIKVTADGAHTLTYFSQTPQGGTEAAKKVTFAIDTTAPVTTGSMKAITSGTQIILSAKDNLSGVASTVYTVDGGMQQTYTAPFTVTATTAHTIVYHSTDKAGNVEKSQTLTVASGTIHTFSSGLQMFSVPADYSALTLSETLVQSGTTSAPLLAVWVPSKVNYVLSPMAPADHLRPGQGYWVRLNGTGSLSSMGTPTPTSAPFSISLGEGWNMIGDPFDSTISLSNVVVTAGGKSYTGISAASSSGVVGYLLYSYPAGSTAYISENGTGNVTPYVGYWVYAFQPCTLTMTAP